jgi:hypothetical protein
LLGEVVTPAADLYAMGLILLEMMMGRGPFAGMSLGNIILRQTSPEAIVVPAIVAERPLGRIITRALAKDLSQRYTRAEEMLADLVRLRVEPAPPIAATAADLVPPNRAAGSRPWPIWATLLLGAALAAGVLVSAIHFSGPEGTSGGAAGDVGDASADEPQGSAGTILDAAESSGATAAAQQREACDAGTARACSVLGWWTIEGLEGLSPDDQAGADLVQRGCEGNDPLGCAYLGWLHLFGRAVPLDIERAQQLLAPACEAGEQLGCGWLGMLYEFGTGVTRDIVRAEALYRSACEVGWGGFCHQLGRIYASGAPPIPADDSLSRSYYARACILGWLPACATP